MEGLGNEKSSGYSPREVEVFFEGYECRKQEEAEEDYDKAVETFDSPDWRAKETAKFLELFGPGTGRTCPYEEDIQPDELGTEVYLSLEEAHERLEEADAAECRDALGRCGLTGKVCGSEDDCTVDALDKAQDLFFNSSLATRIAGEDEASQKIKDNYYKFDRFEILGYCANCDREIAKGQPYITSGAFDPEVKFCKPSCVEKLKEWQSR